MLDFDVENGAYCYTQCYFFLFTSLSINFKWNTPKMLYYFIKLFYLRLEIEYVFQNGATRALVSAIFHMRETDAQSTEN